jgi:hypothetical protein
MTAAQILELLRLEADRRRAHWIGGVPTQLDLLAMCKRVAHRYQLELDAVLAACPPVVRGRWAGERGRG